jgi:parallel beta-helix repeat protein
VVLPLFAVFFVFVPSAFAAALYTIIDDGPAGTGGDCNLIGSWDGLTKTCTLSTDISAPSADAIDITSNGIILDGAGHTLTGGGTFIGVFAVNVDGVTITNLNVNHFFSGIEIYGGGNGIIRDNTATGNSEGITLLGAPSDATAFILVNGNILTGNSTGIKLSEAHFSQIEKNKINVSTSHKGISTSGASVNQIRYNTITGDGSTTGIELAQASLGSWIFGNFIGSHSTGLTITDSSGLQVWNNNFVNNIGHMGVFGTSTSNSFNNTAPEGGNYWDTFATAAQGCVNANNDRFCDSAYNSPYGIGGTDNLPLARRSYYFTWYDQVSAGAQNWVLMTNPIDAALYPEEDAWFDLSIAGSAKTLPTSTAGGMRGQVSPLEGITPSFPGVINGPVDVGYHARMKQMVSQRVLWGDSLEEVTGTDAADLTDHYYWAWYDQQNPGYTNWILIGNPTTDTVRAEIRIAGNLVADPDTGLDYFVLPPGGRVTPTFPSVIGGPVEVKAYLNGGVWPGNARDVIASQRVLSNYGSAFNEVEGTPAGDLTSDYLWTWYDQLSPGALNWILVANPDGGDAQIYYKVTVAGAVQTGSDFHPGDECKGPIADNGNEYPQFDTLRNGPVRVQTYSDASCSVPANAIASQRTVWGPSFEEVPGYPAGQVTTNYHWTWYDQLSPGVTNWVLVANPAAATSAGFQIKIGETLMDLDNATPGQQGDFLYPGDVKQYTFPGTMSGPVQVIADQNVISSQRVLWKGYFNEVMGTVLN